MIGAVVQVATIFGTLQRQNYYSKLPVMLVTLDV